LTFKLDQPERHCRLFPPEIPEWTPNNFTSETNRLITVQKTGLSKNYTSQLRLFPLRAGSHMSFHHAIIPHLLDYQEVVGAACWSGQRPAVQAPCERMTLINVLYIVSSNSALILRVQVVWQADPELIGTTLFEFWVIHSYLVLCSSAVWCLLTDFTARIWAQLLAHYVMVTCLVTNSCQVVMYSGGTLVILQQLCHILVYPVRHD